LEKVDANLKRVVGRGEVGEKRLVGSNRTWHVKPKCLKV